MPKAPNKTSLRQKWSPGCKGGGKSKGVDMIKHEMIKNIEYKFHNEIWRVAKRYIEIKFEEPEHRKIEKPVSRYAIGFNPFMVRQGF